jgi:hypothetical protein
VFDRALVASQLAARIYGAGRFVDALNDFHSCKPCPLCSTSCSVRAASIRIHTKECSRQAHAKLIYHVIDACVAQIKNGNEIVVEKVNYNGECAGIRNRG